MLRYAFRSVNPIALIVAIMSVPSLALGQGVPRTSWGHPDLQGTWSTATITPFERPAEFAGKEFLTTEEAAEFERLTLERTNRDRRDGTAEADVARAYNDFWWDSGTRVVPTRRTSLVVDPPDGRVPALTPRGAAAARGRRRSAQATRTGRPSRRPQPVGAMHHARRADRDAAAGLQQQLPDHSDARSRRDSRGDDSRRAHHSDRRPSAPAADDPSTGWAIPSDAGKATRSSSRRRTSRTRRTYRGPASNLRLVERFTRTAPDILVYRVTIEDPTTFTRPWTVELPVRCRATDEIYEYACHEANYGLEGILRGHRAEEQRSGDDRSEKSQR